MGFYGRAFEGPSRKRQKEQDDIATTPCQEMIFDTNANFTPMSHPSFLASMVIQLEKKPSHLTTLIPMPKVSCGTPPSG